jgi:rubrerythrin
MVILLDLGTFGVIIKFALEIESSVNVFYEEAVKLAKDDNLVALFGNFVSRGKKRLDTLERVRRENVTEMILEPIEGLDTDSFGIDTILSQDVDDATIKTLATSIEDTLQKFYTTAAKKIEFLPEAEYAFELLAEKNEEAIKKLSD